MWNWQKSNQLSYYKDRDDMQTATKTEYITRKKSTTLFLFMFSPYGINSKPNVKEIHLFFDDILIFTDYAS